MLLETDNQPFNIFNAGFNNEITGDPEITSNHEIIFAVDDDQMQLDMIKNSLKSINRQLFLVTAKSREEVLEKLEYLKSNGLRPNLLLTDANLEYGDSSCEDGEWICDTLDIFFPSDENKKVKPIPKIAITGINCGEGFAKLETKVNMVIKKPFKPHDLTTPVIEILESESK